MAATLPDRTGQTYKKLIAHRALLLLLSTAGARFPRLAA